MSQIRELRPLAGVISGVRTFEGEGFAVRRPFPTNRLDHLGPFLLLDEMGPSENGPGEAKGASDHPHRGFETVTYMLDGEITHKDSLGNQGLIAPGDVQWMTAGAGIVHSELPSSPILAHGGRMHGFQLWVNLPAAAKMHRPRYQDLTASRLPSVAFDGGSAVVIGGRAFDTDGPGEIFLPVTYFHLRVDPERTIDLEIEPSHLAFVYAFIGRARVGVDATAIEAGDMAVFPSGTGLLRVISGAGGLEALVGSAEPLADPVARYGPFVMNTRAEILQAFDDFQTGKMGSIQPERA